MKEGFDLVGWTDSNWAQDPNDHQSMSRFAFDIGEGVISQSSKKQPTVVTSSVEAEYIASANATKEAVWLQTLLRELDLPQKKATIIHANNQGSIAFAHNPVLHSRAQYIDIQHHFIQEHVERGEVSLNYMSTKEMMADIFTKALPCKSFEKFQMNLGVLHVA